MSENISKGLEAAIKLIASFNPLNPTDVMIARSLEKQAIKEAEADKREELGFPRDEDEHLMQIRLENLATDFAMSKDEEAYCQQCGWKGNWNDCDTGWETIGASEDGPGAGFTTYFCPECGEESVEADRRNPDIGA